MKSTVRRAKGARRSQAARPSQRVIASMIRTLEKARAERRRRFKIALRAYRPLIAFNRTLYDKNSPAVRAYGAEMARTLKRLRRQTASGGGRGRPVPNGDWNTAPFLGPITTVPVYQPLTSMTVASDAQGGGRFTFPNGLPMGRLVGCSLTVIGSGSASVSQLAWTSFHSDDAGPTEVGLHFNPIGPINVDGFLDYAEAHCSIQVQVFEGDIASTKLVSSDDDPFVYAYVQSIGGPPVYFTPQPSDVGAVFDRKPGTDYSLRVTCVFEATCAAAEAMPSSAYVSQMLSLGLTMFLEP